MSTNDIKECVVLGLAVGVASYTITKSVAFEALRWWIEDKHHENGGVWEYLHELFMCPYCISHWLSFGVVALYQPRLVSSSVSIVDYFLTALAITWLATIAGGLIWRAFKPTEVIHHSEVHNENNQKEENVQ